MVNLPKFHWFVLDINAEPWAIGPLSIGYAKGGGKFPSVGQNAQLKAYQEAVAESVKRQFAGEMIPLGEKVELEFYFWRNRAEYTTASQRAHRKHEADATNMQKATEDALQGILFANDRDVSSIRSVIVEQGPDVSPRIVIKFGLYEPIGIDDLPGSVKEKIWAAPAEQSDNSWNGSTT
jgi:Holliday junction resolvase RusA-like endonuclease